jgi:hypothetical protein
VVPVHAAVANGRIEVITDHQEDRNAIRISVIDGHCCVLCSNSSMQQRHDRLAFDLRVTMSHRHGRLFVTARQQFRLGVAAVVDDGFVETLKARAGIRRDEFKVQTLDHVHHEVGPGILDDAYVLSSCGASFIRELCLIWNWSSRPALTLLGCFCFNGGFRNECSRASCSAFQKSAPIDGSFLHISPMVGILGRRKNSEVQEFFLRPKSLPHFSLMIC